MTSFSLETPADLIYLAMSFIEPRAVQIACQLKIFTLIEREQIYTAEALAAKAHIHAGALQRVLLVCANLGLVYQEGDEWHLTSLAHDYLVEGQPGYLGPVFIMSSRSFHSFDQLPTYVETGTPIAPPPHQQGLAAVQAFVNNSRAMGRVQAAYLTQAVSPLHLANKRTLLDIGAGSGIYSLPLLAQFPSLHYYGLDLPHVVEVAEPSLKTEQYTWIRRDVFAEGLPDLFFDIVLLASFIHGFSQQRTHQLLVDIYQALPDDGLLLIQDHFLRSDAKNPGLASLFNLNIALHNVGGEVQTLSTMEQQLREIGFRTIEIFAPTNQRGLLPIVAAIK